MHFKLCVVLNENEMSDIQNSVGEKIEKYNENLVVEPYVVRTQSEIVDFYREGLRRTLNSSGYETFKEKCASGEATEDDIEYWKDAEERLTWDDEDFYIWIAAHYLADEEIDEDGNEISTYNPDSRWDYWQVGGRYAYTLKLKNGETVNYAQVKEIAKGRSDEEYRKGLRLWELLIEGSECKNDEERELFDDWSYYKRDYIKNRYLNKERFAEEYSTEFSTYAFLTKDGEWLEEDSYGSFEQGNMTDEEFYNLRYQRSREFTDMIYELIRELDENDYIVVVDCHI